MNENEKQLVLISAKCNMIVTSLQFLYLIRYYLLNAAFVVPTAQYKNSNLCTDIDTKVELFNYGADALVSLCWMWRFIHFVFI